MCATVSRGRLRPAVRAASAAVVASAILTAAPGLAPTTAFAEATASRSISEPSSTRLQDVPQLPAGSYAGLDAQGRPLTFYVDATHTKLQDISVPTVGLSCVPDGQNVFDKLQIASVALQTDGSFSSTTTQTGVYAGHPATFTYIFRGQISGASSLTGVLRETVKYTDTPARSCTSNDQTWSASRESQPAQPTTPPPSGSYSGLDTQGRPLTFYVSAARTSLQDVSVPTVGLSCVPDGANVFDKLQIASVALAADGSFTSTTTQTGVYAGHPATFTYVFRGHVHGLNPSGLARLAGQLRETVKYTDTPARSCTSNDQAWTATRDNQPAQPTTPPPSGSYSGLDTQGRPLTFYVSAARTSLQDVSVPTVGLSCVPDGANVFDKLQIASVALAADGSFTSTTTQTGVYAGHPATFTYVFRGHVHGLNPSGLARLAGQLRETVKYTDTPARSCTSNDQAWTTTRDNPSPRNPRHPRRPAATRASTPRAARSPSTCPPLARVCKTCRCRRSGCRVSPMVPTSSTSSRSPRSRWPPTGRSPPRRPRPGCTPGTRPRSPMSSVDTCTG